MADQMRVLVFKRKHEDGTDELRMTPRRAWGICYGHILRDMHARKINESTWPGVPEDAGGSVQVHYNLENDRQLTVDEDGIYLVYGSTWADISEYVGSVKLNRLMEVARWYGPFNSRMLATFIATANDAELPHVHMPGMLRSSMTDMAVAHVFNATIWSIDKNGRTVIGDA